MTPPHLRLQQWWSRTAADIPVGRCSDDKIAALERRYSLSLPADFRDYLRFSCPVAENWDHEMGNWWPIERLKNIPDEYEHRVFVRLPEDGRKFLFFLDHFMWAWAWAISCGEDETRGKVVLIGGAERFVADSFSQFVERYTTDWASIS